ncbi:MAG: hypothetical protein AAGG44_17460, partial [Planctomycetota bacterium]
RNDAIKLTRPVLLVYLCMVAFVCGGAACPSRRTIAEFQPPIVFSNQPDLPEIVAHVNKSLALNDLESNNLTVTGPELPARLRGRIKWQRPRNFRLEAYLGTKLMKAFEAGSNDQRFWLQRNSDIYFASHREFDSYAGPRNVLPVSPLWLREAMGVVEFAPNFAHEPPIEHPDGKLEIRSIFPSNRPGAFHQRHIVIDASTGVIEQTILKDHTGRMIARAFQSDHQYYSEIDFSLPHKIDVQLIPEVGPPLMFTIEVGFYLINQSEGNNPSQWQFPDTTGMNQVNLTQLNGAGQLTVIPPNYTPARGAIASPYVTRANKNINIRGWNR